MRPSAAMPTPTGEEEGRAFLQERLAFPDARSDLYSFGCVGYFLLTGRPVFEGETVIELVGSHLHKSPVPLDQRLGGPVPESLSALILACLEKDPAGRPESALACIAALDASEDVPAWTDDQASAWWSTEGTRLLARRTLRRNPPPPRRRSSALAPLSA